jgi:hypothetical protein
MWHGCWGMACRIFPIEHRSKYKHDQIYKFLQVISVVMWSFKMWKMLLPWLTNSLESEYWVLRKWTADSAKSTPSHDMLEISEITWPGKSAGSIAFSRCPHREHLRKITRTYIRDFDNYLFYNCTARMYLEGAAARQPVRAQRGTRCARKWGGIEIRAVFSHRARSSSCRIVCS